jgi:hypothetical protein
MESLLRSEIQLEERGAHPRREEGEEEKGAKVAVAQEFERFESRGSTEDTCTEGQTTTKHKA